VEVICRRSPINSKTPRADQERKVENSCKPPGPSTAKAKISDVELIYFNPYFDRIFRQIYFNMDAPLTDEQRQMMDVIVRHGTVSVLDAEAIVKKLSEQSIDSLPKLKILAESCCINKELTSEKVEAVREVIQPVAGGEAKYIVAQCVSYSIVDYLNQGMICLRDLSSPYPWLDVSCPT
jgi:hypothetical protein